MSDNSKQPENEVVPFSYKRTQKDAPPKPPKPQPQDNTENKTTKKE